VERNANGVEPGALDELDIVAGDVVAAVALPEAHGFFRAEQRLGKGFNLPWRLRAAVKLQHVTFGNEPVTEVGSTQQQRLASTINQLFALGMNESGLRSGEYRTAQKNGQQEAGKRTKGQLTSGWSIRLCGMHVSLRGEM
jgi:hypothetical protein